MDKEKKQIKVIIVQYQISIVREKRGFWHETNNRYCTVIRYPRVLKRAEGTLVI